MEVAFQNCPPFTDYICEINNTQLDNAKDIYIVMSMLALLIIFLVIALRLNFIK